MSLDELTSGLKDLEEKGKADLKLSAATRDQYLKLIGDFRNRVKANHDSVDAQGLNTLGNVGMFGSAMQTKQNLLVDTAAFKTTLSRYLDYLDELEAAVKKAATRLIHNG